MLGDRIERAEIGKSDAITQEHYYNSALAVNARRELYKFVVSIDSIEKDTPEAINIYDKAEEYLRPLSGDETIIDVGCGDGQFVVRLAEKGHRGRLIGINNFASNYFGSQEIAIKSNMTNVSFFEQDARRLDLPANSADIVTALFLLYHVDRPDLALREFSRILKPDGKLVISVRSADNLGRIWQFGQAVATVFGRRSWTGNDFYDNFDITAAMEELPAQFEIVGEPYIQSPENTVIALRGNHWNDYRDALMFTVRDNIVGQGPWISATEMGAVIDEVVKPVFDAEIAERGYFSEQVHQAIFVCKNTKQILD